MCSPAELWHVHALFSDFTPFVEVDLAVLPCTLGLIVELL